MTQGEREPTRADEQIIESGAAVPPEILEPSAAAIAETRRKERAAGNADDIEPVPERDMDKPARRED